MRRLKTSDIQIISLLRRNCRISLTSLAKRTKVAHSTIFDRLRSKTYSFVTRKTILVDFAQLGFFSHAYILLSVEKSDKHSLIMHLMKNHNVNSLFQINNGWDVLLECVFRDIRAMEKFVDQLSSRFKLIDKQVHYVVDELKRETFLTDPVFAQMMLSEPNH